MDPLDDVALLQIVVLQQDLLERDVEEARKRHRTSCVPSSLAACRPGKSSVQTENVFWGRSKIYIKKIGWWYGIRHQWRDYNSGRSDCIRAVIERLSTVSDGIWSAFQLNSFHMELDSGNTQDAFGVHSGSFETHSGHSDRICSGLPFRFSLEWDQYLWNAVRIFRKQSECS